MSELSPIPSSESSAVAQIITLQHEITEAARTSFDKAITLGGLLAQQKERLGQATENLACVFEIKREADRLFQFWFEVTLYCERALGVVLIEKEKVEALLGGDR